MDWDLFCKEQEQVLTQNRHRISFFLSLTREFDDLDIAVLPLKGLDLVLRACPSPAMRPMADMDLLIRKKDIHRVMEFFERKGFLRKPDEGLTYLSPDGLLNLDIIWDIWYLSGPDHEKLWQRTVTREFEGQNLRFLHPEDFLIYHAAYTAAHRGSFAPVFGQDLELFLEAEGQNLDWKYLSLEAARLGLRPALFHAFSHSESTRKYAALFEPRSFFEKLKTDAYKKIVTEEPRLQVSYGFTWLEYPGLRGKLKLLREKFLPSPFELEIHRGIKGPAAYLQYLFFHPFNLLLRSFRTP